jgi:putative hemolysin
LLAAVQIGVTLSGFLSAALGAEKLGRFVIPWLEERGLSNSAANTASLIGLTLIIAYISLVFGELAPKKLGLFRAESIAMGSAGFIDFIANAFRPIIWLLSKSTDLVLRIFGIDSKEERSQMSEEELLDLVAGHAALTDEERDIVEEVFNASERQVHEVMVPRTEVDFIDGSLSIAKAIALAAEKSHSRYPVVRGSSDEVIGFIHVRDLIDPSLINSQAKIQELSRNIMYLPGTKGILPALPDHAFTADASGAGAASPGPARRVGDEAAALARVIPVAAIRPGTIRKPPPMPKKPAARPTASPTGASRTIIR